MADPNEVDTAEFFLPITTFTPEKKQPFSSRVTIDFGALSDVGKVRQNNEDAFLIFRTGRYWQKISSSIPENLLPEHHEENGYCMAVADGMGGLAAGEVASSVALSTIVNLMLSSVKWALQLDHPDLGETEVREAIERATNYLNQADLTLAQQAEADPSLSGMGTTLTGCYSYGDELFVYHVGDSRLYLFRNGKLTRLTRDQTLAQALADAGDIPQEAVAGHYLKHILTQAVGRQKGDLKVEIHRLKLSDGDSLLLCTDGLTDLVKDDQLAEILSLQGASQEKCRSLVDLALSRGGKDNVTALVAQYSLPS